MRDSCSWCENDFEAGDTIIKMSDPDAVHVEDSTLAFDTTDCLLKYIVANLIATEIYEPEESEDNNEE